MKGFQNSDFYFTCVVAYFEILFIGDNIKLIDPNYGAVNGM